MEHRANPNPGRMTAIGVALAVVLPASSGCAFANRGTLQLSRHISIGQELMDLQKAHEAGAINDEEYALVKCKTMALVDSIEVVEAVDKYTPDRLSEHEEEATARLLARGS